MKAMHRMVKIIQFPKKPLEEQVDSLLKLYNEDKVNNLVLGYTVEDPDNEEFPHKYGAFWFGEASCLYILGLIRKLDEMVIDFMKEHNY